LIKIMSSFGSTKISSSLFGEQLPSSPVKLIFGADIRRLKLYPRTFPHLLDVVRAAFGSSTPKSLVIQYIDDEDELVTVTNTLELREAFSCMCSDPKKALKLIISESCKTYATDSKILISSGFKKPSAANCNRISSVETAGSAATVAQPQPIRLPSDPFPDLKTSFSASTSSKEFANASGCIPERSNASQEFNILSNQYQNENQPSFANVRDDFLSLLKSIVQNEQIMATLPVLLDDVVTYLFQSQSPSLAFEKFLFAPGIIENPNAKRLASHVNRLGDYLNHFGRFLKPQYLPLIKSQIPSFVSMLPSLVDSLTRTNCSFFSQFPSLPISLWSLLSFGMPRVPTSSNAAPNVCSRDGLDLGNLLSMLGFQSNSNSSASCPTSDVANDNQEEEEENDKEETSCSKDSQAPSRSDTYDEIHYGVTCDGCGQTPIRGVRFQCQVCNGGNFDLCYACESKNQHPSDHPLIKLRASSNHIFVPPLAEHTRCFPGWYHRFMKGCPLRSRCHHRVSWRHRNYACHRSDDNENSTTVPKPKAKFLKDVNLPDQSNVPPGQIVIKTWRLLNDGPHPWPDGVKLIFFRGDRNLLGNQEEFPIQAASPNSVVDASVVLQTPAIKGRYVAYFRLADKDRNMFGPRLWADLFVGGESKKQDQLNANTEASSCSSISTASSAPSASEPVNGDMKVNQPPNSVVSSVSSSSTTAVAQLEATTYSTISSPTEAVALDAKKCNVEKYAVQEQELQRLGFKDTDQNLHLLEYFDGNLQSVIDFLLEKSC